MEHQEQLNFDGADAAIEINMDLPTNVTGHDVESYPGLATLLRSLSQRLNKEGLSLSTERGVKQAEENLEKAKYSYLQQHILHYELHEMMIDNDIAQQEVAVESQTEQYNKALSECVSTAEACCYLHPRPTGAGEETGTLLGLTEEDLLKSNPNMKKISILQQQFIPQLESRLKQKCEEVASCHFSSSTESDQLSFAKATRLPDILKEECAKLKEEKEASRQDKAVISKQTWLLYNALLEALNILEEQISRNRALTEALDILEELITRHRMTIQAEKDSVMTDLLKAQCHAMQLKIRVFRAMLHCDMYRPEAVAALRKIREHLTGKIQEKELELSSLDQSVQAYQSIGMGFEELVQEYGRLQKSIASKKWALTELNRSMADGSMDD